jgi:hypothetical protein
MVLSMQRVKGDDDDEKPAHVSRFSSRVRAGCPW